MTHALAGRSAVLDGELVVLVGSVGRPDFHGRRRRHTAQRLVSPNCPGRRTADRVRLGLVPAVAEPETREPLHP